MHALVSSSPILTVAAAVAALLISAVFVAVSQVVFRIIGLVVRAALVMATVRVVLLLAPIAVLVLLTGAYLHR
jgi:hypothetical protein